jgi:endonuclease-3
MNEKPEEKKTRAKKIVSILKKKYPEAKTKLIFENPFQLLISTILSAQCTDDRVNIVTKELYKKYKTPKDFAGAKLPDLEKAVYSTGFYKAKAKKIQECSISILEKFNGKVPDNMDDLLLLEGVGRKTANVLLCSAFGKPAIPVDTHVKRLSNLLELSIESNPDKIEFDLMEVLDQKNWTLYSDLMMAHGRKICNAKKPNCIECKIVDYCPSKNYKILMET